MGRKKSALPIIMGMEPPTKELLMFRTEKPLKGISCFIFHASFPEGTKSGDVLEFGLDDVERNGCACWLHFINTETLRKFGQMLIDFADREERNDTD